MECPRLVLDRFARALTYPVAFIFFLAALPAQAEIYRWTDENGRTHFSDRAPPGTVDAHAQNADPAPQAVTEFAPSPANFIPTAELPKRSTLGGLPEKIRPGTPGVTDVFFLGFAGDAEQGVFMRETLYAKKLFERQYDARGRAFALINHSTTDGHIPHANIDNLGAMLIALGKAMDDEDMLFLYLTSHGSKDHELVIEMPPHDYRWLSAPTLRRLLDASGIRYRILVVSACYSGGFLPALRGPATVVATAADALNTSFGCSDANAFTWYGKALFERQMSQGTPIMTALHEARNIVREMEADAGYEHSNPQLDVGDEIQAVVTRLLPGVPTSAPRRNQAGTDSTDINVPLIVQVDRWRDRDAIESRTETICVRCLPGEKMDSKKNTSAARAKLFSPSLRELQKGLSKRAGIFRDTTSVANEDDDAVARVQANSDGGGYLEILVTASQCGAIVMARPHSAACPGVMTLSSA